MAKPGAKKTVSMALGCVAATIAAPALAPWLAGSGIIISELFKDEGIGKLALNSIADFATELGGSALEKLPEAFSQEHNYDLERALATAYLEALQYLNSKANTNKLRDQFALFMPLWRERVRYSLGNADIASLFVVYDEARRFSAHKYILALDEPDKAAVMLATDAVFTLERWAAEAEARRGMIQKLMLSPGVSFPDSLRAHLRATLPPQIAHRLGQIVRRPEFNRSWIAYQQAYLSAFHQCLRQLDANNITLLTRLEQLTQQPQFTLALANELAEFLTLARKQTVERQRYERESIERLRSLEQSLLQAIRGTRAEVQSGFGIVNEKLDQLIGHSKGIQKTFSTPKPPAIKISLPAPLTPHLFGRDDELRLLDEAWANPSTNLVVFHALGGAGKSALVSKWLAQMAAKNYDGAQRVFGWSFFSQGSSENRSDSSEAFIDSALAFFGVTVEGGYFRKADRLAEALRAERTILILDGVEPLQYPPNSAGLPEGGLKDRALQTILTQLAAQQPGLCVITSRERLSDLNGYDEATVIQRALDHLPYATTAGEQPCAQLLRALGALGDDDEMLAAAREFQGHAYGLTLLGSYVAEVLGGDLRRRKDIANLFDDDRFGSQADRIIAAYETWLGDGVEVAILRLLGLFDRPAEAASIAALRAAPVIAGLTETLQGLSEVKWQQALSRLRRIHLLASANAAGELDAHPLVREHFRQQLKTHAPDAWRAGSLCLYEHLTHTAKDLPDTLAEMESLFAAVAHGCAAGRHQEIFQEVYLRRIRRGDEHFSIYKLGAIGAELAALQSFFVVPWRQLTAELHKASQARLLSEVGGLMASLGRTSEAEQPMEMSLKMFIDQRNLKNAAITAINISDLFLTLGKVTQSISSAKQSVFLANQCGVTEWQWQVISFAKLADALHQAGRLNEAVVVFRKAESLQKKMHRTYPLLYASQGFRYCDLLLGLGKAHAVRDRAARTLGWLKEKYPLFDLALDNLSLGRAYLQIATDASHYAKAADYLQRAVSGLREAGRQDYLPRGLLARAELYRLMGDHLSLERAQTDLAEARSIAERGEMRLHLCDYHLESARLHLAQGHTEGARSHWETARKMVDEVGYHRRDGELAELAAQLST